MIGALEGERMQNVNSLVDEIAAIINAGMLVGPPDYSWNIKSRPNYIVDVVDKAGSREDQRLLMCTHLRLWSDVLHWLEQLWNERAERAEVSRVISYFIYHIDLRSAEDLRLFDFIGRMAQTSASLAEFELANHAVFGRNGDPAVKARAAVSIILNSTDKKVHHQAQRLMYDEHLKSEWVRHVLHSLHEESLSNDESQRTLDFLRIVLLSSRS
jgi:hypothetical protein